MLINLASPLQTESIVDGPGFRAVVWTQGCHHDCKGCHNPQTHDPRVGKEYSIKDLKNQISNLKLHKGITLSGGEPFNQADKCLLLANHAKSEGLSVWAFSGYTFEYILNDAPADMRKLLMSLDVLIDGKFQLENKNLLLTYRGSSNQRVIDVKTSLLENKIVTLLFDDNR